MAHIPTYLAIDIKSFYASVECLERGLDPLDTNLVVADASRTEKTICLAVSPSLKSYGLPGRARLFEVISKLKQLNHQREPLDGSSFLASNLNKNKHKAIDYIIAKPRMSLYLEYSTRIYSIYLKYFSPDDIHVYSIDEVFIDATHYLDTYELDAFHLVQNIIHDIYKEVGITVTAGIGTNLYLAKVAMDIVAKHKEPDEKGARIAYLNTYAYRKLLWSHTPLTDFWRVGKGISKKLNNIGLYTMGDIARCSLEDEEKLYNLFGVNAELLIDHAWGWEPCTMSAIKAYKAPSKSIGTGQVLSCAYDYKKTEIILKEMIESLSMDLFEKHRVTNKLVLTIGYDIENMKDYRGEIMEDRYGRKLPKHLHGTINLDRYTSSYKLMCDALLRFYHLHINHTLTIRRIQLNATQVRSDDDIPMTYKQLSLFDEEKIEVDLSKEKKLQGVTLDIKKKYGKNALLKGADLQEGATTRERNKMIGGHNA